MKMSGSDEQNTECPLCMEALEMDDINFYPCTCGYQICRFCWHRIRTDENGLCPACRKHYPEDPADFKPLTQEELQRIKNEKRQKDLQRKQKISENRKHLGNVRVVQKNLVFVVGLSQRLADPEVLKRHEYFGKFGKIHKVVINHSTSYAGSQGPSASAYVTYYRVEDALRAIQAVNNIHVDGRTLKASLGTTKYCSHFLKGQQCPKPDCMYLHELGDDAASFTKDEMQQGKHQEYEKKLHEQLFNSSSKNATSPTNANLPPNSNSVAASEANGGVRESWPSLQGGHQSNAGACRTSKGQSKESGDSQHRSNNSRHRNISEEDQKWSKEKSGSSENDINPAHTRSNMLSQRSSSPPNGNNADVTINHVLHSEMRTHSPSLPNSSGTSPGIRQAQPSPLVPPMCRDATPPNSTTPSSCSIPLAPSVRPASQTSSNVSSPAQSLGNLESSSSSASSSLSSSSADIMDPYFGTRNGFSPSTSTTNSIPQTSNPALDWMSSSPPVDTTAGISSDPLTLQSNTDWQAAFGFSSSQSKDDDLGFDPWDESSKALADLMEKETYSDPLLGPSMNHSSRSIPHEMNHMEPPPHLLHSSHLHPHPHHPHAHLQMPRRLGAPPGFAPNHMTNPYHVSRPIPTGPHQLQQTVLNSPNHHYGDSYMGGIPKTNHFKDIQGNHSKNQDVYSMREWQDNLRALFPNINITFGAPNCQTQPPVQQKGWSVPHTAPTEVPWVAQDPAVVSAGSITDVRSDSPPHWMKSLQQLTEIDHPMSYNNHRRLPVVNQFSYRHPQWSTPAQIPPPGFGNPLRHSVKPSETQKLMDNF